MKGGGVVKEWPARTGNDYRYLKSLLENERASSEILPIGPVSLIAKMISSLLGLSKAINDLLPGSLEQRSCC